MKIVFTSYSASPSFKEPHSWLKRIDSYTGILESLGKKHEVVSIERIDYEGNYQQNGVSYLFTRQKKKVKRFPLAIHSLLHSLQPDAVFINGVLFSFQIMQLRRKLGKKIKIILIHRSEKPPAGLKRALSRWADPHVNAYVFSSLEFRDEWKGCINESKMREVQMASSIFSPKDRDVARQFTGVSGAPVYLWVGMLNTRKDPLTAVEAFTEFVRISPGARLYMIYQSGDLFTQIMQWIDQHPGCKTSIVLKGAVPHDELLYWYNSADFFISASHAEGIGIAVSEAMSCGCIPIVTGISSFKKMTGNGECGILFQPGNKEALVNALVNSTKMDIEKERAKVMYRFNNELSFDSISAKTERMLEELV